MKLPEKVRVGETLSARWLNQVVDCLKELAKAANMVGNGTSTSSIEYSGSELRDTKYRGTGGSDLQEFKVFPFQLRLKPKQLCEVDESGNWPKIAQIKAGAIIDYMGKTRPVPENATIYDYTEGWIDIGAFSEKLEKVFCIIKQNYKGEIISADIASEQKDFVPWGKTEENATGEGTLSVFIGTYQLRRINEVNRAHIYQAHTGTLDLQTVQVEKLVTEDGGSGNGSGEEEEYYTAPESEEYESKPASLFRKRDEHLFIFKKLICGEGLELADGENLKITLRRANSVWPSGSGSSGGSASGSSDGPTITIGGVEDIVFDREILEPLIEAGIIRIPYADTIKEVTGVISGLVVKYAPAVLNDDGSVTFLGEDGSRLPDTPAPADAGSGSVSGSGAAVYHNQIVGGVIYITIPIFQEGSGSQSMSASASGSDSSSASATGSDGDTESATDSATGSSSDTESGSASASGSVSASGSASTSGSASASASDSASASASASEASGSTGASDSTAGSSSVAGSSSSSSGSSGGGSSSSGGGSEPGGGSVPGGSVPGGGSSSGSSGGSGCCGCDCATKLADMQARIDELSKRIDELEKKECTCKCGDLMAQIQAAVAAEAQAIANSINYEISVNGTVVTTTEYG
ncbi:MAG: hypothetical protein IKC09_01995, partial [Oscillospiraceae bacterium]|nr:hypothetical protein [Oscillospiraceae bacterium]